MRIGLVCPYSLTIPVTYGGEFSVRGVFVYKRDISISLRNSGFERAEVTRKIAFEDEPAEESAKADDRPR